MFLTPLSRCLDPITAWWETSFARKFRCVALALVLILGVVLIEANRLFDLPGDLDALPTNHLAAIAWAVTLLLIFEITDMVLSLQRSVAMSVGRHLQVYALLLLRDAFAKLAALPEPITITPEQYPVIGVMASDAVGALLIFAGSTWFAKLQRHTPIVREAEAAERFIAAKKIIALALLGTFAFLCVRELVVLFWGDGGHKIFDHFFTVLIFADVLLAIVSLGFTSKPPIVFRNFGFALGAILLRLAVASPEYVRPSLGVAGALVAIGVTLAYNWAMSESPNGDPFEHDEE